MIGELSAEQAGEITERLHELSIEFGDEDVLSCYAEMFRVNAEGTRTYGLAHPECKEDCDLVASLYDGIASRLDHCAMDFYVSTK